MSVGAAVWAPLAWPPGSGKFTKTPCFRPVTVSNGCLNFDLLFKKGSAMRSRSLLASELMRPVGDPVGDQIKHRPACPNCGRPMHLTRSMPRAGGLSDLRMFNCGECGVGAIKAADDEF